MQQLLEMLTGQQNQSNLNDIMNFAKKFMR